jgi:hypothetical protein
MEGGDDLYDDGDSDLMEVNVLDLAEEDTQWETVVDRITTVEGERRLKMIEEAVLKVQNRNN